MATTTNPLGSPAQNNTKSKSASNAGKMAAAAGAGAVFGGVAGYAVNSALNDEPEVEAIEEEIVEVDEPEFVSEHEVEAPVQAAPAQPAHTAHAQAVSSNEAPAAEPIDAPAADPDAPIAVTEPAIVEPGSEVDPSPEVEPYSEADIEITTDPLDISIEDEVDIVIAGNEVDPNDIETVDPIFDQITTVYSVDGEAHTHAYYHHDGSDEEYVMIDLNDDDVFDVILDSEENLVGYTGLTVGDVEQMMTSDDPNYMAASDNNEIDGLDDIDISNDLIIT